MTNAGFDSDAARGRAVKHSRRTMLGATATAAAVGGASLLGRSAAARQATPVAGAGSITPEVLETALAKLDSLAAETVANGAVPGAAIAVIYQDEVVYTNGFGVRDVDTGDPVDAETVFQIASLSKPISSSVIAAIVGDGDASWDDPVANRYPDFVLADPWITQELSIRDCFSHRSGLSGLVGAELEAIGVSRDEIMHRLRYAPISGEFRQTYSYSNMMMTAGAEAVVAPLGQSWEDVAEARVFTPLGMSATSYRYQDFVDQANRSELHVKVDGAWASEIQRDAQIQAPAGGVSTSVRDLAEWVRMQLAGGMYNGEQVIDSAALGLTHIPQIMRGPSPVTGRPSFYALGWGVDTNVDGRITWRHNGAFTHGARTDALLLPDEQLGIVVLTNAFPTGAPDALSDSFYDFVFHGEPRRDWFAIYNAGFQAIFDAFGGDLTRFATPPDPVLPPLPDSAYVGAYANDYLGEVRVEAADGGLQVVIGPDEQIWPLTHWDRDVFTYVAFPEPPAPLVAARFTIDDTGQAAELLLENMNDIGLGTVRRV